MPDNFIQNLLLKHDEVTCIVWQSDNLVEIFRKNYPPFQAAILKQKIVTPEHVQPFLDTPVSVVVNFPKVGKWTGGAIELCEASWQAWGQWGVLLRAINNETPQSTENPEIAFSRKALGQHSRVKNISFEFDHLLLIEHDLGNTLKVALLYEYDLTGNDIRNTWEEFGAFDILLKTNPNGSILEDAYDVAETLGTKVFGIRDILSYLAKGNF
ncbi:hypothetical protein [Sneathiella aquimaris]|uniref:hypothetical protein n=1 Tax=Sneathiella aquimaris TaxID=2599305 RepID=UPI00146BDBBB|nr:hypothetical protein [Sneathiella aquimaris]